MHLLKALGKNAKKCFLKRENNLNVDLLFAFTSIFDLSLRLSQEKPQLNYQPRFLVYSPIGEFYCFAAILLT